MSEDCLDLLTSEQTFTSRPYKHIRTYLLYRSFQVHNHHFLDSFERLRASIKSRTKRLLWSAERSPKVIVDISFRRERGRIDYSFGKILEISKKGVELEL